MTIPEDTRAALAVAVQEELARRRLLDFAKRVYPGFQTPPHLRLIAELLEAVEAGKNRRLMINVPVRHGKSVLASQVAVAWFLGRNARKNVILASHSEELAVRNSRIAKNLIADASRWPFPAVKLAADSQAAGRWNTVQGGGVYAVGVGGAITGRGADLLVLDDILHDGLSSSEREKAWSWYTEVAIPRLEPGGAVVVIGARFADDDLCGRILESEDGPAWTVVRLPALAEDDDPLGREPGVPLWSERMGLDELAMRRQIMGSLAFEAQFQQRPLPRGGSMIHVDWLQQRFDELPDDSPKRDWFGMMTRPRRNLIIQAVDCASKTGVANDWSVIATIATDYKNFYILDIWRKRVEFFELIQAVRENYLVHRPNAVFIEDASAGTAIVQELRRTSAFPVIPIRPEGSKESRISAISPLFESGKVKLRQNAPWLSSFILETASFPAGRFDDQVDAAALGLTRLSAEIANFERNKRILKLYQNGISNFR